MNKVAIYPGTFDPITFGHIDVIKKGLKLFNKIKWLFLNAFTTTLTMKFPMVLLVKVNSPLLELIWAGILEALKLPSGVGDRYEYPGSKGTGEGEFGGSYVAWPGKWSKGIPNSIYKESKSGFNLHGPSRISVGQDPHIKSNWSIEFGFKFWR